MKNLMKAALVSFAAISVASVAGAQQLPPQKVLTDLSAEQIKKLNGLGSISDDNGTTPQYDFHVTQILTPAQQAKYNDLKDGPRQTPGSVNYKFNIDSK